MSPLPPEARDGLMRAWLHILKQRHPHLTWIPAPDQVRHDGSDSNGERSSGRADKHPGKHQPQREVTMSDHQPTGERPSNEIDGLRDWAEELLGNWDLSQTRLARPEEREDVAARINAETAFVFHDYINDLDPYGDHPDLPPEAVQISRDYFAADSKEHIAVRFWDLPEATRLALQPKLAAEALNAQRIIGGLVNLGRTGTASAAQDDSRPNGTR